MRKIAILILSMLALANCGIDYGPSNMPISWTPVRDYVYGILSQKYHLSDDTKALIKIYMMPADKIPEACGGVSPYACSDTNLNILMSVDFVNTPQQFCRVLAHELTHLGLYLSRGNGDGAHNSIDFVNNITICNNIENMVDLSTMEPLNKEDY